MNRQTWGVNVRWIIARDLADVLAIDFDSYHDFWGADDFRLRLGERQTIGLIAERGDKLVGYMLYTLRTRSIYCPRLAVHPLFRRHGVGTSLVNKLVSKLSTHRRPRLVLDVDEGNTRAHLFLRACGLTCVEITHRGGETLYTFEKRVGTVSCVETGRDY